VRERVGLGRWHIVALLALTSALTLAAFGNTLRAGFVYDDDWTIVHNPHLDWPLGRLLVASWKGESRRMRIPDATRPAMVASTWIDRRLFGVNPRGYHAHSLALHALASAVAGLAVFALTRRRRTAALTAVLFATAPIHAEVVAAANNREDLIAALGVLGALTLLFWPRTRHTDADTARWCTAGMAGLAAASWLLGLAAKESAVVLVPLGLAAWIRHRRLRGWAREREPMLLALLAVGVVWASWRVGLRFGDDDIPTAGPMGVAQRVARRARDEAWVTAGEVLPFWPSPEHGRLDPASPAWLAVAVCVVALVVVLARRRATRVPALGLALALLAPLATSPLVGPVNEHADRYLYLGVLGGSVIWSWALGRAADALGPPRGRAALLAAVVVIGAVCTALSGRAAAVWHDELSLWTEATRVAPGSPRAWTGLSHAMRLAGRVDEAIDLSARALAIDPAYAPAHLTRGYNLLRAGRRDEALSEIAYVEEHAPDLPGLAHGVECASRSTPDAATCVDWGR
jgi:protein O-mannosyl-transferase